MLKRRLVDDRYVLAAGQDLQGSQRYSIQGHLGGGAFSASYRATDESGRDCFIKEVLSALRPSEREELRRVYAQECDVLRRIGNYELCPRFWDAFESCGYSYIVQDFVPGRDLNTLLEARTQFDEEILVRWSLCLCHALAFLHSRQVVHHDLKPENIRMNADADPVILDFGAARWYRSADEKSDILYGSEGYLAPEYASQQVEDLPAGMRMDIFALGRILVEMLVGQRMTQAEIDSRHDQLYGSILHSKTLNIGLVRAIFKSVSYNPEMRYPSALEMEKDLVEAAPPIGRCRPMRLDLGVASDVRPREEVVTVYNVGGGTLTGEASTDAEWLEVGATGATTARSQPLNGNRQAVRVVAFPERLAPGTAAEGRVIFNFPAGYGTATVSLRRAADVSQVTLQPERIRLVAEPGGPARGTVTVANRGTTRVTVQLHSPDPQRLAVAPAALDVGPGARAEAVLSTEQPGDGDVGPLSWSVEGVSRPPIPIEIQVRGGGLLGGLWKRGGKK